MKVIIYICFIVVIHFFNCGLSKKVVVTGAAGRTGRIVLQRLVDEGSYSILGLTRSEKSAKKLRKIIKNSSSHASASSFDVQACDVTSIDALSESLRDADTVILCTSAVPKIKPLSIVKLLILKLFRKQGRPEFRFIKNGDPYNVDWLGAKNQIDAAKNNGISQFIFVSSMGGTQPENFLNTIGRIEGDDKSGNILLWKREAEKYLINSGLNYCIIHPGGLLDQPGGRREIITDVDDKLLAREVRSIPRADVAEVCVQAIGVGGGAASNKSFDIIAGPDKGKSVTTYWGNFFEATGNCNYD